MIFHLITAHSKKILEDHKKDKHLVYQGNKEQHNLLIQMTQIIQGNIYKNRSKGNKG